MAQQNTIIPFQENCKTTYVAKDMIWKAYITKANDSAKTWPDNWGFLINSGEVFLIFDSFKFKLKHINLFFKFN